MFYIVLMVWYTYLNPLMTCVLFQANLLGEKIEDPPLHGCEVCDMPILHYGRMVCDFFPVFNAVLCERRSVVFIIDIE